MSITTDDWHDETLNRLSNSLIYVILKEKCQSEPSGNQILALVDEATYYGYSKTKAILKHMGEFTLHDGDHLFRVLKLMEKLLPEETIRLLSAPELMLLILGAFFHDIGMAPEEKHVISWKKIWDATPLFDTEEEKGEYNKFKRFSSARPDQIDQIKSCLAKGENTTAETLKGYLLSDYIRITHADRAKEIIHKDWNERIKYRDTDLTVDFAQICFSHNEDALTLLDMDKRYLCGPGIYACLPLTAAILRLADILDFDAKRTPLVLFSHLNVKHPVSIKEWNKHRAIEAWDINPEEIKFHAKCSHPAIQASVHEFCDIIDRELSACNNVISSINDFNKANGIGIHVKIPYKVDRTKIETKKDVLGNPLYIYRETQFNLSKRQVIELLMGTKLYGKPEVALRELLQNSVDACLLRQALEKKWESLYAPEITVKYYSENSEDILEVTDNGTGMDQYIIDNYYSKVGSSFYKSSDFYDLRSQSNADFVPTSRFGIGILSCFMVADSLIVETRRVYGPHNSSEPLNLKIEGQESIFWITKGKKEIPGTTTRLILRKKENPWQRLSEEQFIKSVEEIIPNPPFKIQIQTNTHKKTRDENSFKELTAKSLKDYSWDDHENIKVLEIEIDDPKLGLIGSAIVGILESKGEPTEKIDVTSRAVEIDRQSYNLEKSIKLAENEIESYTSSITINEEGEVNVDSRYSSLAKSKSLLSLHGIEVPASLFPQSYLLNKGEVKIVWPFPILLVVDIKGDQDLDLNSSRNQVIMSDRWIQFEENLSYLVCFGVRKSVSEEYWTKLKVILLEKAKNNVNFITGLNKVA